MSNMVIKGTEEKIFFSATNYYGLTLNMDVYDDDNGTFLVNNVPMTEIVEPVTSLATTVVGAHAAKTKLVTLSDVTGILPTDRLKIDTGIYRVLKVDNVNNTVTLHKGLEADVSDLATVDRVGNMGIYRTRLIITQIGSYVIQAKDTTYGIHKTESISIKDKSLEEMFQITGEQIDETGRVIKDSDSFTIIM